jgi:hypothetical protein
VPVLLGLGHDICTEVATGSSSVLHHHVLSETGLEPLTEEATGEIDGSTRRKGYDESDGTCREVGDLTACH